MLQRTALTSETIPLGIGYYTVPEAARLVRVPPRSIRRWLGGYDYRSNGNYFRMPPLWKPELPAANDDRIELGFRDLIELRFVHAFVSQGIDLRIVRACLDRAKNLTGEERPFSTRRFRTDGRTIFMEEVKTLGGETLTDLRRGQFVIKTVIEQTFRDLEFEAEVVARWRPFHGRDSIVVDPKRAFGQPILAAFGTPTSALADAVVAEGSLERVAALYEVTIATVRDAVRFEQYLHAA